MTPAQARIACVGSVLANRAMGESMSNHDERIAARRSLENWLKFHGAALTKDEHAAVENVRANLPDTPLSHEEKRHRSYRLAAEEQKRNRPKRDT